MHEHQLMFIIKLVFTDNSIQDIKINENGDMLIKYYDKGANFHYKMLTGNQRLVNLEGIDD